LEINIHDNFIPNLIFYLTENKTRVYYKANTVNADWVSITYLKWTPHEMHKNNVAKCRVPYFGVRGMYSYHWDFKRLIQTLVSVTNKFVSFNLQLA
jgi:hypothetical protein